MSANLIAALMLISETNFTNYFTDRQRSYGKLNFSVVCVCVCVSVSVSFCSQEIGVDPGFTVRGGSNPPEGANI